jgi:Pvc16 N-terminal domain/Carboxypeptidase regulatory-like domain
MIRDLSLTLKAVLQDSSFAAQFPELATADIVFDRPLDPFTPSKTTIDVFLYDLRENLELRLNDPVIESRDGHGITHQAPLRLACSYLVTAWPVTGADLALQEHRLLTQVLRVLSRYPTIPKNFLKGSLATQDPPLPMVALHPDALKNLAEFWSSLGSKLKASLTVTVTISVPVFLDSDDFLVTTEFNNFIQGDPAVSESLVQFGGQVLNLSTRQPISNALVILEDGRRETSGDNGEFIFQAVSAGAHSLTAIAVGYQPLAPPHAFQVPGQPQDYVISLKPL